MMHIKHDENKCSNPNTQTEDVHKRSNLVSPEDTEGDGKEGAEHKFSLL
jgi:hypothetical protein